MRLSLLPGQRPARRRRRNDHRWLRRLLYTIISVYAGDLSPVSFFPGFRHVSCDIMTTWLTAEQYPSLAVMLSASPAMNDMAYCSWHAHAAADINIKLSSISPRGCRRQIRRALGFTHSEATGPGQRSLSSCSGHGGCGAVSRHMRGAHGVRGPRTKSFAAS